MVSPLPPPPPRSSRPDPASMDRVQAKLSRLFSQAGGGIGAAQGMNEEAQEAIRNRQVNGRKTASGGVADVSISGAGRPRDPRFYWQDQGLPYQVEKPDELAKVRKFCRDLYLTHPLLPSAIDVYSIWPLTGMELSCKDSAITTWYEDLFFDQLDYEEYLVEVGREHWKVGEAWPFGSFNDLLGVWEDDELIDPDDVTVTRSPFFKEPRFEMRLPQVLRDLLKNQQPEHEYKALLAAYPQLKRFQSVEGDDIFMSVSNILLKQLAFKPHPFHNRGLPLLMRAFRSVMQEERLNSAMDAIADRLYTPMILTKLGASASDLGTGVPWIPTPEDIAAFEAAVDAALAGDFRMLTHHFAVSMETVFGREAIPNFDVDFERLDGKMLQPFGLSKTMLIGGKAGETYAADAINRDLVSQLLSTYQRRIKRFVKDRMLVVAEAQEHYDYETRGGRRYPIMEEVLEIDEESGAQIIVERPKLLVPDLNLRAMNMRDDTTQRQFIEALVEAGVPISIKTRMQNIPFDFEEEIHQVREEEVRKALAAQETRREIYTALRNADLPIPEELQAEYGPKPMQDGEEPTVVEEQNPVPRLGDPEIVPGMAPMAQLPEEAQGGDEGPPPDNVVRMPRNKIMDGQTRPPESDEMRAGMPRSASLEDDEEAPTGLDMPGPRHVGMRRHANLKRDEPFPEEETG